MNMYVENIVSFIGPYNSDKEIWTMIGRYILS